MARFVFKLQAVLDQRIAREQQKQLAVAQLERERLEAEKDITDQQRSIERERDELRDLLGRERTAGDSSFQPVDLSGVRMQAAAAVRLTARAQQAVLRLAGIHRRLDAARLELLHAATQRKAVELLREKQHAEFLAAERKRDAAAVDELATLKGNRPHPPHESEAA
ncbi:MAG: hypothetical protein GIKADHBN_02815 [Phycisphaerales bacterium]|nr:hypothetical protein [Phycisphaerales bacterium]